MEHEIDFEILNRFQRGVDNDTSLIEGVYPRGGHKRLLIFNEGIFPIIYSTAITHKLVPAFPILNTCFNPGMEARSNLFSPTSNKITLNCRPIAPAFFKMCLL